MKIEGDFNGVKWLLETQEPHSMTKWAETFQNVSLRKGTAGLKQWDCSSF